MTSVAVNNICLNLQLKRNLAEEKPNSCSQAVHAFSVSGDLKTQDIGFWSVKTFPGEIKEEQKEEEKWRINSSKDFRFILFF